MDKIELLAPCGHFEGMRAAVAGGADAVYVGGMAFGARKEAAFSNEDLLEVVRFCHLHGVRVYVTVNTTILENELEALADYIGFLYENDVDAVIVQDLGAAKLVKELYPDFELHFSTQMTLHNVAGVQFAKQFGASRVVVARENTLAEIKKMAQHGVELEVFVHGAICMSYSGQCLMSSMIGGRSGNRGACAQTCRLPYELLELDSGKMLGREQVGNFLLSPRDMKTIDEVGSLIEAGATSFKIEGRLKKADYVAVITKAYREAIDSYLATGQVAVPKRAHQDMEQIFTRGFTKGYLFGEKGEAFMSTQRPNHQGVEIGRVQKVKGRRATIALNRPLLAQDGIRILGVKEQGLQVQKMFVDKAPVTEATKLVEIDLPQPTERGAKVLRTASIALAKESEQATLRPIPIYGTARFVIDEPASLMVWDEAGNVVEVTTVAPQHSTQKALEANRIRAQLEKTGATPFVFADLSLTVDAGMTLPISALNGLRRQALEELTLKRQKRHERGPVRSWQPPVKETPTIKQTATLAVSVTDLSQLQAALEAGATTVYYRDLATLAEAVAIGGTRVAAHTRRIMADGEIAYAKKLFAKLPLKKVMLGELGMLQALQGEGYELVADFGFNANNSLTVDVLKQLAVSQATVSFEATGRQLGELAQNSCLPLEAIVFTRVPMMITRHCPIKHQLEPATDHCQGRYCFQKDYGLKDRMGQVMPLKNSGNCIIEILNSKHLIWLDQIPKLKQQGIKSFRLDFSMESPMEIKAAIHAFLAAMDGKPAKNWLETYKSRQDFTKGHWSRGIQ